MTLRECVARAVLLGLGLLAIPAARAAEQQSLEETIIIDEEPEAFVEYATGPFAVRLRRALRNACVSLTRPSQFCGGKPLRFLRVVSVYGRKQDYGFACDRETLYARNKYFIPAEIRASSSCVYIACLNRDGSCEADRERLARGDDES
jgi:hypothetical protein